MTDFDQQRIANWIGEGFAILCVRAAGGSADERNVRLGFEAVLRQLGLPPLRVIARTVPPAGRPITATAGDWRLIVHALDRCRTLFARYDGVLNAAQQRTRALVETTRVFAESELRARSQRTESTRGTQPKPEQPVEGGVAPLQPLAGAV